MIYILAGMCFIVLAISSRLNERITSFKKRELFSRPALLKDLPSVSVCIPARNEHHAMTDCLQRVLASTYPKLEVIVIDDESVDNTPTLVKSFAHEGVRFIAGGEVPEGWLGKNHALNTLMREANGTYVLFMDVDTKIEPNTIGQMVAYMTEYKLLMMSVLPVRADMFRASVFFAPLRYFWHVIASHRSHPVAASSAWLVNRRSFEDAAGDFTEFKTAVEPEIEIAGLFAKQDAYRFLVSDRLLGISYEKRFMSQIETIVRLRYPMLNFSVVRSVFACVVLLAFALMPYVAAVAGIVSGNIYVVALAALLLLVEVYAYYRYLRVVWRRGSLLGAWLVTIILLEDVVVTIISAIGYVTHTITWKGRPVARDITRAR